MIDRRPKTPISSGLAQANEAGRELKRLQRLAKILDSAVAIPGTKFRFGLDSVTGLVPVVGDGVTAVASGYLVHRARKLGVRKRTLTKMYRNVALDLLLGAVPLIGDLFDVGFKANLRNLRMLEEDLKRHRGN